VNKQLRAAVAFLRKSPVLSECFVDDLLGLYELNGFITAERSTNCLYYVPMERLHSLLQALGALTFPLSLVLEQLCL
jgi:hypothetical protein